MYYDCLPLDQGDVVRMGLREFRTTTFNEYANTDYSGQIYVKLTFVTVNAVSTVIHQLKMQDRMVKIRFREDWHHILDWVLFRIQSWTLFGSHDNSRCGASLEAAYSLGAKITIKNVKYTQSLQHDEKEKLFI